ncbi:Serine/threonine-protein phosphatase 6 regulatory ankyrin repeat subunit C [Madurella mycetomatis]|uniref:Serine/threonine-protein phosphatase 6 regulatory ankyrin repeat subunit C n=1 Tax=Madurella mycetomatis TaxID=100816 RepID=A0A175W2Z8_9PEZI|nr:Serine/threonine-protein phosphatase 6 regulatory ankyrin repeat subunit C [Madurella mycetomatis]
MHFQDSDGKTPLHQAVIEKNNEFVKSYLYAGAAVNTKDHVRNSPLHYAIIAGEIASVELLLKFGAEVDAKGQFGQSALHLAVSSVNMVNMLVKEGADPSSQDDRGNTPLHLALANLARTDRVTDALIEAGSDPNRENKTGTTPFLQLLDANIKLREYVPKFLECGASVTKAMVNGKTPLQIFLSRSPDEWVQSHNESYFVLKCLLSKGASIETPTSSGEPLVAYFFRNHYRKWFTNNELAGKLCELSSPGLVLANGNTLLHELCAYLKPESYCGPSTAVLLGVILQKGADPNHRNHAGETPLMVLFRSCDSKGGVEKATAMLLTHGAHVSRSVMLNAVKKFPSASSMLRSLTQAYLSRGQGRESRTPPETLEEQARNSGKRWWAEWEQVAEEVDWNKIKVFIEKSLGYEPPHVNRRAVMVVCAVLVEKYLRVREEAIPGQPTERDQMRKHVAEVLRECRARDIPVDMCCFDLLLEVCL